MRRRTRGRLARKRRFRERPARQHQVQHARRGYRIAGLIGLMYPFLRGPSLRIRARFVALQHGAKAAEPHFRKAITVSEATQNRWELAYKLLVARG